MIKQILWSMHINTLLILEIILKLMIDSFQYFTSWDLIKLNFY